MGSETNKRDQMKKDSKATFVYEWDDGKERYRMLSVGKFSRGYEDKIVFDRLTSDSLGEPCWVKIYELDPREGIGSILVSAIKSLLRVT